MLDKAETTHSLFKLMDACTQCRQIFHACAGALTNPTHRNALDRIPQKLEQFGIELRNEIRRLGQHEDFVIFRFESIQGYSVTLALDHILDCIRRHSTAHSPHTPELCSTGSFPICSGHVRNLILYQQRPKRVSKGFPT